MRLDAVIKSLSTANAAIKNSASPTMIAGWYPTFSASGQDVWLPNYRFNQKGIVVSAVGARCGKAFKADGKWNVCANTHALSVNEAIADRDYCWYLLNNENWWIKGGTAQPFVKVKESLKREFEFPLLSEQREIVRRLDTIAHIIDLKHEELNALDTLVKSRFVEMFGNPITNSLNLPVKPMSQQYRLKAGITTAADAIHVLTKGEYEIPCYGGNGIRGYVKESSYDGTFPIIGRQGALCGNVQFATGKFHATEHAVLVTSLNGDHPIWTYYMLGLMDLYRFHTGAAQPGLAVKTLNKVNVIAPEKSQQNQFASFATCVESAKTTIRDSLSETQTLFDSLMQEYFHE